MSAFHLKSPGSPAANPTIDAAGANLLSYIARLVPLWADDPRAPRLDRLRTQLPCSAATQLFIFLTRRICRF